MYEKDEFCLSEMGNEEKQFDSMCRKPDKNQLFCQSKELYEQVK